jgi:hypothetical protein
LYPVTMPPLVVKVPMVRAAAAAEAAVGIHTHHL